MNKKWKLISYVLAGALFLGVSGTTLTGCKDYDDDIDSLNARVDEVAKSASEALDSKVKALEAQITTLTNAKDQLAKDLEAAKADADKKVAEAKNAANGAQGTADKALENVQDALARVATLESQMTAAQNALTALEGQCKNLKEEIDGVKASVEANAATAAEEFLKVNKKIDEVKNELVASLSLLQTQVNTIAANLATLRTEFDTANKAIGQNTTDINNLREQILTLQEGLKAQAEALNTYKEDVTTLLGDKVDVTAFNTKIGEVTTSISNLQTEVNGLAAKWKADITTELLNYVNKTDLTAAVGTLETKITTAVGALETSINTKLSGYVTTETLNGYLGAEGTITKEIATINEKLNTLSSLFSKRLTAMIFAPTTYVDGIEVIEFATLKYRNWVNLKGDEADGDQNVTINNGATKAEYYVSPNNVTKASVKGLKILVNHATNTKAIDPLEISDYDIDPLSGKMVVSLKKTTTDAFAGKGDEFIVMALQAAVEPTEEEVKASIAPVVTSDWARIYETSVTPYIHNTATETCDVKDVDGSTGIASQFYAYKEIHSKQGTVVGEDEVCDTDGKYIVKRLVYDAAPFDLNTLVTVCDKEGHFYKAADYGLKFKFELVNYVLQDAHEVKTKQHNFAKIDENGMITSRANDGTPNNADAVGCEPMIRVTLVDAAHNNNVVDVRYFKIKWIAQPKTVELGEIKAFIGDFDCGSKYPCVVETEDMNNKVYTKVNISKEMFHTLYDLELGKVYADAAKAIAGTPAATNLGTITEIPATGSAVTYNLKWEYTVGAITDAEYEAGQAVRTVYGRYIHKGNDADIIVFSLKLTLKINKMTVRGYNEPQWDASPVLSTNANKVYTVNPALGSDAIYGNTKFIDCQIITSLLNGYLNGQPANVLAVVSGGATEANFMFDKDRLTATLGAGWSVSVDGKTLSNGGVVAARIEEGIIRLEENPVPTLTEHGEPTVAAQKLLGKNVPVKLIAKNCANITKTVDQFLVKFMDPLKMTVNQEETNLYDIADGGSKISIEKAVTLKEAFGDRRNIIWIEGGVRKTNAELITWYNVGAVTWDLDNAKTNLKVQDGSIVFTPTCNNPWSAVADRYNLVVVNDGKELKFENKSNSALGQAIQVEIPVSLETKWKPNLTDSDRGTVTVTINPRLNNN